MGAPASEELPRIRVAALLVTDDGIVLVRHSKDGKEYHLLPGGGVAWGESLEEALVREVREETGYECLPGRPVLVNDSIDPAGGRHVVQITFTGSIVGGAPTGQPGDPRVVSVDHVAPEELGSLDFRPPLASHLERLAHTADVPCEYLGPLWSEDT